MQLSPETEVKSIQRKIFDSTMNEKRREEEKLESMKASLNKQHQEEMSQVKLNLNRKIEDLETSLSRVQEALRNEQGIREESETLLQEQTSLAAALHEQVKKIMAAASL